MNDPFNLSQISGPTVQNQTPTSPKPKSKKNAVIFLVGAIALLVLSGIVYAKYGFSVSADNESDNARITISGLSKEGKLGDSVRANITVKSAVNINDTNLIISAEGLNLLEDKSLGLSTLTEDEKSLYAGSSDTDLIWAIGAIDAQKAKTLKLESVISGESQPASLQLKLFKIEASQTNCGILGLSKCLSDKKPTQIAFASAQIKVTDQKQIDIKPGWSIIGLPYALPPSSLRELFLSLEDRKAFIYKPESGEYIDIVSEISKGKEDILSLITPGRGVLIYSKQGEKITLPESKAETSVSQDTKIALKVGHNMIANPYPSARIIFSEQIRIQELSDDGTPTGSQISFKDAISRNIVNIPQMIKNKTFTNSNSEKSVLENAAEFSQIAYGYNILPFSGLIIEAKKPLQIIFGSDDLARADLLSEQRVREIESCLQQKGLDQYGNKKGTAYPDGAPLNKSGEKYTNPMDSVIDKNLDVSC